jgi:peptidoglycan DL-endopeptidase CwlO
VSKAPARRRRTPAAALVAAVTLLLSGIALPPGTAGAAPKPAPTPGAEGGTPTLRDVIERTSRAYVEARAAARESGKKQLTLRIELQRQETLKASLTPQVAEIARQAYRMGRVGPALTLLNAGDSDDFLARATLLDQMATLDSQRLAALNAAIERAAQAKTLIDIEVKKQKAHEANMAKQKAEAEKALAQAGGKSTGGYVAATSPVARQSPRGRDGSWPSQSCNQPDPTTGGCVTPRLLFALKETQRLGFKRFVSCYRGGGPYEHPKGRACDFSAFRSGFGSGDAQGGDRRYGNDLAAFFVRNADKLGVLYVIWYRQIWLPATGWRSYSGAYGDPSSDHTNHVHLSVL